MTYKLQHRRGDGEDRDQTEVHYACKVLLKGPPVCGALLLTLLENDILKLRLAETPPASQSQLTQAVPRREGEREKLEHAHQNGQRRFRWYTPSAYMADHVWFETTDRYFVVSKSLFY